MTTLPGCRYSRVLRGVLRSGRGTSLSLGPFAITLLLPFAQAPVSADRGAEAAEKFGRTSGPAMRCDFRPTVPSLDYSLHFETGYDLKIPASQFDNGRHEIEILLKIMPVPPSGAPVFLRDTVNLAGGLAIENTGTFAIDPGSYAIDALAIDEAGRSCRARWKADVKPLPPVRSIATGSQTTIFLNAESTTPHASVLLPDDVTMLTGTLSALMSRLTPDSTRLVLFNLETESELVMLDAFNGANIDLVVRALSSARFGTVDIHSLRNSGGPADFLMKLIGDETAKAGNVQRFIFTGPRADKGDAAARSAFLALAAELPRPLPAIVYLEYREHTQTMGSKFPSMVTVQPSPGYPMSAEYPVPTTPGQVRMPQTLAPVTLPDSIEQMVRQLGGRTIPFATPEEFANALNRIANPR